MSIVRQSADIMLDAFKTHPETTLKVIQKPNNKAYKGTWFYTMKSTVDGTTSDCWVTINGAILERAMANPADPNDNRNSIDGLADSLSIVVWDKDDPSVAERQYARFFTEDAKARRGALTTFKENPDNKIPASVPVHHIISTHGGPSSDKPGEPLSKHYVTIQLKPGSFSDKDTRLHLRGLPFFTIYDADKPYTVKINGNEVIRYELATVPEEVTETIDGKLVTKIVNVPLNKNNRYKFMTAGSEIVIGHLDASSAIRSQSGGLSSPYRAFELVVRSAGVGGFIDSGNARAAPSAPHSATSSAAPSAPQQEAPPATQNEAPPATQNEELPAVNTDALAAALQGIAE